MASLARLTVRMVRLAVRLAWLTPQQARGAKYDMWRATRENGRKSFSTHYQRVSKVYLSLFITLYHSVSLFITLRGL